MFLWVCARFEVGLGANVLKNRVKTAQEANVLKNRVKNRSRRTPTPHPNVGIQAPQAVRKMFGCGVGAPASHGGRGSVVVLLRSRARWAGVPKERVLERS